MRLPRLRQWAFRPYFNRFDALAIACAAHWFDFDSFGWALLFLVVAAGLSHWGARSL